MGKFHARLYKTDRARDFDHEQVGTPHLGFQECADNGGSRIGMFGCDRFTRRSIDKVSNGLWFSLLVLGSSWMVIL